jgi:ADP-ribosylglycohydrolase
MDGGRVEAPAVRDRAVGAMVGMAVGNALGAGYAFQPRPRPADVHMRAGGLGPYEPGEWGDDTAMAIPLLEVLGDGGSLLDTAAQDQVAARWAQWRAASKDAAPIIAQVFAGYVPELGAASLRDRAAWLHARNPSSGAGNASLMRTTPIAVGLLEDTATLCKAARTYSDLTHANPVAGDACVLWNLAQRHAIRSGESDLASGLAQIPRERQSMWERLITQAEVGSPQDFALHNGWAAQLVQTAWSAVTTCQTEGPAHFEDSLRLAVAAGGDTPTVAAVTGGLLGARWGVSAIPLEWRRVLFGWPGYRDRDLVHMVLGILEGRTWPARCHPAPPEWPAVAHPYDDGVLLGHAGCVLDLPAGVDAVVSLCELGAHESPSAVAPPDHVDVWLEDSPDPVDNPHLDLVVEQAVDMVMRLRGEGRRVLVHSAHGRSRLPLIAAVYGARLAALPAQEVLEQLRLVLPHVRLNSAFDEFLRAWD